MGKNYKSIFNALKKCFNKKWNKVFNDKMLNDTEAAHLQK